MNSRLDPKQFGLPPRTVIEQLEGDTIALVISRKSRIIMADGQKILEKLRKIRATQPQIKVALKTTAPVCSKTKTFLESEGIQVILR